MNISVWSWWWGSTTPTAGYLHHGQAIGKAVFEKCESTGGSRTFLNFSIFLDQDHTSPTPQVALSNSFLLWSPKCFARLQVTNNFIFNQINQGSFSCRESTPSADDAASCCSASDELSSNSSITRFPKSKPWSTLSTGPFQLNDSAAVCNLCHDHVLFPFFILHCLPFPSILPKVQKIITNSALGINWLPDFFYCQSWTFFPDLLRRKVPQLPTTAW